MRKLNCMFPRFHDTKCAQHWFHFTLPHGETTLTPCRVLWTRYFSITGLLTCNHRNTLMAAGYSTCDGQTDPHSGGHGSEGVLINTMLLAVYRGPQLSYNTSFFFRLIAHSTVFIVPSIKFITHSNWDCFTRTAENCSIVYMLNFLVSNSVLLSTTDNIRLSCQSSIIVYLPVHISLFIYAFILFSSPSAMRGHKQPCNFSHNSRHIYIYH